MSNVTKLVINRPTKENTIGERLSYLRNRANLNQEELSNKLKVVSRSAIAMYETDQRPIPADVLYHLAKFFNVTSDYIIGLSDIENYDIENNAIHKKLGLSNDVIDIIEEYNFLSDGKVLIPTLNYLIEQEKMTHIDSICEEYYQKLAELKISDEEKEIIENKITAIYEESLKKYKSNNYIPVISVIEEYFSIKDISGELAITNDSIENKNKFKTDLEKLDIKKIIINKNLVDTAYLSDISDNLKDLKNKRLETTNKSRTKNKKNH